MLTGHNYTDIQIISSIIGSIISLWDQVRPFLSNKGLKYAMNF